MLGPGDTPNSNLAATLDVLGMEAETTSVENNPMHMALGASGRSTDIPETMDIYGFLIGSWDLDVVGYDDEGHVIETAGEASFGWVLEGRAVQDVFINPRREERRLDSPKFANWYGTTIRIYDASIQGWRVNWFNPHDGIRAELIGRRRGKEIVQEGKFPDGTPIRWSFSDISENSFRWRGERSLDGTSWQLQAEFHARRVRAARHA